MKKVGVILLFVVAVVSIIFVIKILRSADIAEKQVYATLQAVELEHRGVESDVALFIRKDGLSLAGFPAPLVGRVWIVLNRTRGEARIFSMPEDGEKQVSCSLIVELPAETDQQVYDLLRARCIGDSR